MIKKVRKRDGSIVPFQQDKIAEAIWKAVKAVGGTDRQRADIIAEIVSKEIEKRYPGGGIPEVEEIQDTVEKILIEEKHAKVAKAYILYRKSHEELRNVKGLFDTIEVIDDYIGLNDWMVKENSNMGFSLQGLNNYIATKIITNYWVRRIYPEAIRKAHEDVDLHIHDLGTLGAYCFDDKTLILTENGWKLFKDVKKGEKVATKNLETGELEFQIPYDKQIYNYSGEMYSFEERNISLLVTPEHRLLVRKKGKKSWEFVNPSEFKYGMEFDKKLLWKGKSKKTFDIQKIAGGNRKKILPCFKIEDYVEFMGWYISEGSVYEPNKGDYRISIAQSEKEYRKEILELLKKMKIKHNDQSKENIHIHSKDLFYHLKDLGISKDKYVPKYIKELEPQLIKKFLVALFKGDGTLTSNEKLRRYYTKSKQLAEDVTECLLKIGLCGTISKRKNSEMYSVSVENNHLTPIYRKKVLKKNYNGKVYDLSVKNGTLVVMREGKIVVSGNCVGWDLKDLLLTGFKGVPGKIASKPPKHLRTALGQMVNFFYTLQGETAGAQAFSNFDTLLAPFVRYDKLDYPQVKQAMQEFLFNLAVPTRVGFQCMSEDTQILTPFGWKSHNELKEGDIIKTFNVKTNQIEEKPVKRLFAREYEGVMYNLKNRIQDQLISPKHRVVRKKFQSEEYSLEEIEKIEKMKSPFIIPIAGENKSKEINLSDEKIKLIAWIIAEGSVENYSSHRHSNRIAIYQSAIKNPEKYQEITGLLESNRLIYYEKDSTPALGSPVKMMRLNAESSRQIHSLFELGKKIHQIPLKLLNMGCRQSRLFLETYLKADGFENCKISTTSKKILEGLQQIAVNAEYGFTVLKRKPTIGTKPIYVLRLIKHKDTYINKIEKINYKGIIWCPNTENETVIAKRKEKGFITGNTPFTNITMDLKVPEYMMDEPVIIGGVPQKETYKEFQNEINIINKAFAECMIEGDANGRLFTFPIPTYNISKDFDWENPEYDLIWEMTSKYGIPYFSNFINSDMKPEDARSMCCRLRLDQKELRKRGGGLFGSNPLTGCYDEKTEILTKGGWKFFKNLTKKDEVFTLTDNNKIELNKPLKLFEYNHDGEMYNFKTKSFDLLVTPNHRMVVDTCKNKRKFVEAKDFDVNNHRIPKQADWVGEEKENFILPAIEFKKYGRQGRTPYNVIKDSLKVKMDTWLKFFGFWLAEGCTDNEKIAKDHGYRVIITQVNQQKRKEIKEVLDELPFNYYEEKYNFVICNKQLWSYLRQFGNKYEKFIPYEIKNLSKKQLKILFDWMVKGDGHIRKTNGQINYWTASKKLADDLQEVILKLGWLGTIIFQDRKISEIKGRPIKSHLIYCIGVQKAKHYRLRKKNIKKIYYKGKVYCCEVKNHTVFVRRNGKVTWCGNSIGVVTINLPRIGFTAVDEQDFLRKIERLMELAKESLEIKRKNIERFTELGLYPYSRFYLRNVKKRFNEYWKNHFGTIGILGMNEAIMNFMPGENIATPKGKDFSLRIMDFMRNKLEEFQTETGNIYNLEATPGEGTTYRFARGDKKRFGRIIVANEKSVRENNAKPYYTNSTQLPVNYTSDVFEALELQDDLQTKYTGGTVFHTYVGERIPKESVKLIVKKIAESFKLPYFTITPIFSICPIHGYLAGDHEYCPICEQEEDYPQEIEKIMEVKEDDKNKM